jgi:2-keto-3-deoxy-L-arabinonate dehydratase
MNSKAGARRPTLEGIVPILSMPFDDEDRIDDQGLVDQVDFLLAFPVAGIGIGFGSEIFRLTDEERDRSVEIVAKTIAGRCPLMVGVGANSIQAVRQRAVAAARAGANLLMVTPPGFVQPSAGQLVEYFGEVRRATGLPLVIQDAPALTGVNMPPELLAAVADGVENVVALKLESQPSALKVESVVKLVPENIVVLGGAGGIDFYHELERGARGSAPSAALPELFVSVWRLYNAGDAAGARTLFNRYLPILSLGSRSLDTFLHLQKEILRRRGILRSARLRQPSERPDPVLMTELDQLWDLDPLLAVHA